MIPRELIGTAQVPGGEELRLFRHGRDFMIVLDRNELMSTRRSGSEEALATMAWDRIQGAKAPHILIGGYGMGFTLRAALKVLPADGMITVVELVPEILEWARGPMADLAAGCLDDPRVLVVRADVAQFISGVSGEYDAILLDVDNGPDAFTAPSNSKLYGVRGLERARRALVPGGTLAVWSVADDKAFTGRLRGVGFTVETHRVPPRPNSGARHVVWIARAPQ